MYHENIFYPFFTHSPLKIVKKVEVVEITECFYYYIYMNRAAMLFLTSHFYRKYKIVKNLDAYKQSQVFLCPSQRQSALGTPEIETHNQPDAGAGKQ